MVACISLAHPRKSARSSELCGDGQAHGCARSNLIDQASERGPIWPTAFFQFLLFPAKSRGSGLTKLDSSQAGRAPGGFRQLGCCVSRSKEIGAGDGATTRLLSSSRMTRSGMGGLALVEVSQRGGVKRSEAG